MIDDSRAKNPTFDEVRLMRDPLVALTPGNDDDDELIGVSDAVNHSIDDVPVPTRRDRAAVGGLRS